MKYYYFTCSSQTKIILSENEKIEVGDHILMFDGNELIITKMTDSTNVDNVIGKTEKVYQLF